MIEFGGIYGIGYEILDELKVYNFYEIDKKVIFQNNYFGNVADKISVNEDNRNNLYDYEKIKKEVINGFDKNGQGGKS